MHTEAMARGLKLGALLLLLLGASSARAVEVEAEGTPPVVVYQEEPPEPAPAPTAAKRAPQARAGFQMDIRTGVRVPVGNATGEPGDSLGARYGLQVPLVVGLGVKLSPHIYLGGYIGPSFGKEGSDPRTDRLCRRSGSDCSTRSFDLGAQLAYSFAPSARWNPWVSYGLGYESSSQSLTLTSSSDANANHAETSSSEGITFAKLGFGLDYRSKLGVGPYVEAAVGQFLQSNTGVMVASDWSHDIEDTAVHAWLTLGLRLVIFP